MMASWELAETPLSGRHGNPSAPWDIAATIKIDEPLVIRGRDRPPQDIRRTNMYMYTGKRMKQEERRRQQQFRANLTGMALVVTLLAAGTLLGLAVRVSL